MEKVCRRRTMYIEGQQHHEHERLSQAHEQHSEQSKILSFHHSMHKKAAYDSMIDKMNNIILKIPKKNKEIRKIKVLGIAGTDQNISI